MTTQTQQPAAVTQPRSLVLPLMAVGACTFVIGGAAAFGVMQWQAQQEKLAAMSEMVQQLQQQQISQQAAIAVQPAVAQSQDTSDAIATRNASLDLLAVTNAATNPAPEAEVTQAAAVVATSQPRASIANQIRAIAARAADPMVAQAIATDEQRRAAMSAAIAGVNELAEVAASGSYAVHNDFDADNGSIVHLDFVGHEDRQREITALLHDAVLKDEIAYDGSVLRSDGTVDADLLLMSLVQRNLLNGSQAERIVGERLSAEIASLALETAAPETADTDGVRVYTVESGDSLAFIALQFYGDTNAYRVIFDANRAQLETPDRIQIGQQLIIPNV